MKREWTEADANRTGDFRSDMSHERHEAVGIIDIFENFLESRGIEIPNKEKEHAGNGVEIAIIFGSDYYGLEDEITEFLRGQD
jgi:hypothetical protein